MRPWSLISLALVGVGCTVRLPAPGQIGIAVKTTTRVEARVETRVEAPPVAVSMQNAPVVEFFGVPLEGAQDVVFVLDCSGSMAELAQGRLAELAVPPPSPPSPPQDAPPPSWSPPPGPPPAVNEPPSSPPPPAPSSPPGSDPSAEAPPVDSAATVMPPAPAGPPPPRKIDVAQAELADALERLPAGTRLNVLFFNVELDAYAPAFVILDENGRADMISFVRDSLPEGGTALGPAMRTAMLMNARRIVLLSDGLGNIGGNAASVLRDAREAIRGGIRIDTIGIGNDQDGVLLGALARESGGLYQAL
ncbi:MAG TPA: hypothetical protein VM513_13715 [Kofleriaceae bacterium]|nr:hypothetical protein [Kofleriaceae bacterium]